jgi:hypothetical protein
VEVEISHCRPIRPTASILCRIAGFDILECANLDEAVEIAAKHPMARSGRIEIRPFWSEEMKERGHLSG